MNLDLAKERLLEIENLTDQLNDEDANWLINWAIGKLVLALEESSSPEQTDRVIDMARTLNNSAVDPKPDNIAAFLQTYQQTFNTAPLPADPQAFTQVTSDLKGKTPREIMQQIVALAPPNPTTDEPPATDPAEHQRELEQFIGDAHESTAKDVIQKVRRTSNPYGYPTSAASILAEESGIDLPPEPGASSGQLGETSRQPDSENKNKLNPGVEGYRPQSE